MAWEQAHTVVNFLRRHTLRPPYMCWMCPLRALSLPPKNVALPKVSILEGFHLLWPFWDKQAILQWPIKCCYIVSVCALTAHMYTRTNTSAQYCGRTVRLSKPLHRVTLPFPLSSRWGGCTAKSPGWGWAWRHEETEEWVLVFIWWGECHACELHYIAFAGPALINKYNPSLSYS